MILIKNLLTKTLQNPGIQSRGFARMTGRAGKMQHFRYGVAKMRGRWYYRYHKPIGKANWKGYQERYIRPKDVEAKQRLVFAARPTTQQFKQSISWQWRLPKLLAQATTPNQVLDAWILFRYRQPKKVCHYMMTLRRLVEVGGCEPSDWRLQVLLSRMRKSYKRVINVDRLLSNLSSLGLHKEMELVTRFLIPRIALMKPAQLVTVLDSFGRATVRDTAVAGLCARFLKRSLKALSVRDLTQAIRSFGCMEVRNTDFVSKALAEVLKRDLTLVQFRHLLEATRMARVRDYSLIELATIKCRASLLSMSEMNEVCFTVQEIAKLQTPDEELFSEVTKYLDPTRVSLPALVSVVSSVAGSVEPSALMGPLSVIRRTIPLINSRQSVVDLAAVVDRLYEELDRPDEFLEELCTHLVTLRSVSEPYDTPKLAAIAEKRSLWNEGVWRTLASDTRFSMENFEPKDFLAAARVFSTVPADVIPAKRIQLANEVAEWSLKRWEEFKQAEWSELTELLKMTDSFKCNQWCIDEITKKGADLSLIHSRLSASA